MPQRTPLAASNAEAHQYRRLVGRKRIGFSTGLSHCVARHSTDLPDASTLFSSDRPEPSGEAMVANAPWWIGPIASDGLVFIGNAGGDFKSGKGHMFALIQLFVCQPTKIGLAYLHLLPGFAIAAIEDRRSRAYASRRCPFAEHDRLQGRDGFGAYSRANAFTSASIRFASIDEGLLGRPPGLPETPGRKLVDRLPPRAALLQLVC